MQRIQMGALTLLLVFTPLACGATYRWAFCIAAWLGMVSFAAMVLRRLWSERRLLPRTPLDLPIAGVLLAVAVSWWGSIYGEATRWAVLRLAFYVAVFYVARDVSASRRQLLWILFTIIGTGVVMAFLGLVEYAGGPFPQFWKAGDALALNGTFVNRNHFGGYAGMVFMLGLGVFVHRTGGSLGIWVPSLLLVLCTLCLTLSRGAWIGTFVALEFMAVGFMVRRRVSRARIAFTGVGLLVAVIFIILASNPIIDRIETTAELGVAGSMVGRLHVWKACLKLISESPVVGTGLGTFPWAFPKVRPPGLNGRYMEAHNDYLQILTEVGLPVLLALAWGVFVIFRTGVRTYMVTLSRLNAGVSLGALGGIVVILVHSVSDFNIQVTSNGILFSCLAGMVMGAARIEEHYQAETARYLARTAAAAPAPPRAASASSASIDGIH